MSKNQLKKAEQNVINVCKELELAMKYIDAMANFGNVFFDRSESTKFFEGVSLTREAIYSQFTKRILNVLMFTGVGGEEAIKYAREKFDYLIISTGMSTEQEIEKAVADCNPDVIMHTNSTYPSPIEELNLEYITFLKNKYGKEVGYSGHEYGLVTTFATVPLGVTWIERHITLDRTMWGSDHLASVEPAGLFKLVKGIRDVEKALGGNKERTVLGTELDKRKSLRGN